MDLGKFLALLMLVLFIVIMICLGLAYVFTEASRKECIEGFFWSTREMACLPGYKP